MNDNYIMSLLTEMMPGEDTQPRAVGYNDLKNRVQKDVANILNALFKQGRIGYHKTLNGLSIYFK
jgi:predicted component of type VI protein secretion system